MKQKGVGTLIIVFDCNHICYSNIVGHSGTPRGATGLQPPPHTPQNRNLKNTDFVDIMISKVLRDLPFSRNQTMKSADD
jgi:hypothetical protein